MHLLTDSMTAWYSSGPVTPATTPARSLFRIDVQAAEGNVEVEKLHPEFAHWPQSISGQCPIEAAQNRPQSARLRSLTRAVCTTALDASVSVLELASIPHPFAPYSAKPGTVKPFSGYQVTPILYIYIYPYMTPQKPYMLHGRGPSGRVAGQACWGQNSHKTLTLQGIASTLPLDNRTDKSTDSRAGVSNVETTRTSAHNNVTLAAP